MTDATKSSQWRIDFATELSAVYSQHSDVKLIVLGGSPSRGISDQYSDIDMVIYWEKLDNDFLESAPLKPIGGTPKLVLDNRKEGSMMELYVIDTLIVEVGHTTLESWDEMVKMVMEKHNINPMFQKSLGGFLDSHVIYGHDLATRLKAEISEYPEELAKAMLQRNLGFFWKGCITNQGLNRGEIVFFYEALNQTVKRLLGLLSALNKRYFAMYEPRWIEYELSKMSNKPDDMWGRIKNLYEIDPFKAVEKLEILKDEIIDMVRSAYPDLDYKVFDDCEKLRIQATPEKPIIK